MRQLPGTGVADVVLNGGLLVLVAVVIALRLVVWIHRTDGLSERVDPSDRMATDGGVETGSFEMVVADVPTERVVDAIADTAYTGKPGDGKIFVLPVVSAHQIRTGDSGTEAV